MQDATERIDRWASGCKLHKVEIGTGNRLWHGPACVMNALLRATFAAYAVFRTGKETVFYLELVKD